jgi:hypothetical protein
MADDEYEYEYDTSEKSTFLVELDLTTPNGIKRESASRRQGRNRKRNKKKPGAAEDDNDDDVSADEDQEADGLDPDAATGGSKQSPAGSLQILDLNTATPFVAYKGEFYKCDWRDVIGTDVFFAPSHQQMASVPLRSTKDFQLMGTSRIRLLGSKARVFPKAQTRQKQRSQAAQSDDTASKSSAPKTAASQAREQDEFLQRLEKIREARRRQTEEAEEAVGGSSEPA